MNGFKDILLENFQSHTRTKVELAPAGGLCVLVGSSDSGKTAVIRGLKWLLFNTPQGDDFIRVGATLCRVTLELESGHTIIRERTRGGVNRYKIVDPEAMEPNVFEGFGHDVPLEIRQLTGVNTVTIGDMALNLNIAEQLDGPFLGKSISAGARAKVLGKLAGTEEIDFAGKELGTDLYRKNQDVRRLDGEIKDLDRKVEGYSWLDAEAVRIRKLERLVADVKVLQERRARASTLLSDLAYVDVKVLECKRMLARWACLDAVAVEVAGAEAARDSKSMVTRLYDQFCDLDYCVRREQKTIHWHRGIEQAGSLMVAAETSAAKRQQFSSLESRYFKVEGVINEASTLLESLQGIDQAGNILQSVQSLAERRQILARLRNRYIDTRHEVERAQGILARLAGVDEAGMLSGEVVALQERRKLVSGYRFKVVEASTLMEDFQNSVVVLGQKVMSLEQAYTDELAALGICPLCGNVIDQANREHREQEAC